MSESTTSATAARLMRRLGERIRRGRSQKETPRLRDQNVSQEVAAEFTTEELMEFLEGDLHPAQADPAFKERLRGELWELVQRRYRDDQGKD
jgi:hypothetical protein